MENLLPMIDVISQRHQASLVAIGNVLDDCVWSLKLDEFSPNWFLLLGLGTAIEVWMLDFLFKLKTNISIFDGFLVCSIDESLQMDSLLFKWHRISKIFELFYRQSFHLHLCQCLKPNFEFFVHLFEIDKSACENLFEKLEFDIISNMLIEFFIHEKRPRISSNLRDGCLKFFLIILRILIDKFIVADIPDPQFKAFWISFECCFVLFEFGELNVLGPIFIVEGEGFEKMPEKE